MNHESTPNITREHYSKNGNDENSQAQVHNHNLPRYMGGMVLCHDDHQKSLYDPNRRTVSYETDVDTIESVSQLETLHYAAEYIVGWYQKSNMSIKDQALASLTSPMHSIQHIGNQFMRQILPIFFERDPQEGYSKLKNVVPHTTQQELALLINEAEFIDLHRGLQEHLDDTKDERDENVAKRFIKDPEIRGTFIRVDRNQFSGMETDRSLENVLKRGIELSLNPKSEKILFEAAKEASTGAIPITEILKNQKVLKIVGFEGSKIALAVHDAIDHAWMYSLLQRKGFLDEYKDLFNSIGSPHLNDMFSREGETMASIAFGVRYLQTVEKGFQPLISADDLRDKMDQYFKDGLLTQERHLRAYAILMRATPLSREWQSLGFTFSNYIVELDEQRRKHGRIKQRDKCNRIYRELDPYDPDFLSLFIEAHHELNNSANKHRDTLFRFHIIIEDFFLQ